MSTQLWPPEDFPQGHFVSTDLGALASFSWLGSLVGESGFAKGEMDLLLSFNFRERAPLRSSDADSLFDLPRVATGLTNGETGDTG